MANEKSKNNITDFKSKGKSRLSSLTGGKFANGLAIVLIFGSIAAVIYMIYVYQTTMYTNQTLYKQIITTDPNASEQILDSFQIFYRETNAANTNILSILLPVFGAWVGAIIAFYYGNKNFEKLSENYNKAVDAFSTHTESGKLALLKIDDILAKYPDYKNVYQVKISEEVGKSFENRDTLLLIDDKDKPLGFMYKEDILKLNITEAILKNKKDTIKDFASNNPIIDAITGKKWTENGLEDGERNYIEITPNKTLLEAREKMKVLGDQQKIRCLVIDNKEIKGIITYDLISMALMDKSQEGVVD